MSFLNIHLWFNCLQKSLIPSLEEELGPLSPLHQDFVRIVDLCQLDKFTKQFQWKENGRKPHDRLCLAKAFIAKSVFSIPTTEMLIERLQSDTTLRRLCGWERAGLLPERSTFSRAFDQFSLSQLPQQVHAHLIKTHLGQQLVGHISIDSTAIEARESVSASRHPRSGSSNSSSSCEELGNQLDLPAPASVAVEVVPSSATPATVDSSAAATETKQRGRPRKTCPAATSPPQHVKRLDLQPTRSLEQNLADLPTACDVGTKRNSKGYQQSWRGYKLHLAVNDLDIPVAGILTSASLHDSQAAIPLMQSCQEVIEHSLYDLFDAAYDAPQIDAFSRSLGHVPIIDPNPRRSSNPRTLEPHEKVRFRERSSVERVNSDLKDNWGGRFLRVTGALKVGCHLFFGLLALTAHRLVELGRSLGERAGSPQAGDEVPCPSQA